MSVTRAAVLNITTPEGVNFSLPLAGPVTRSLAYMIDFVTIMAVFSLIKPVLETMQVLTGDMGIGMTILLQFVVLEGTRMMCELLWRGQTVGKKVLGLRVVDERGLKLQPSQVVVRNLLRFVDALPFFYAVGGMVALFNSRQQRLGDLAAGTVVVRTLKSQPPDVASVLEGRFNSFREFAHLEARLRQVVTPEEGQLALQALVRREELDEEARVQIYRELADRFRAKVVFPEAAVFGLSDEQYVRNVVETVFRKRGR
ncbi:RDD family protein [Phragmitibacter flavus]|uniref:RDD family protein n=1 Tax=Phragmitibacter flavus TaxID=2576071 RepID=A0A5R8KGV0_9BACT|nr:RDD family protein [Phragmitibacter flavus]TLD71530.1 RDD family protein [Phragmitibacter flavus]